MTDHLFGNNESWLASVIQINELLCDAVDLCDWSSALWCSAHEYSSGWRNDTREGTRGDGLNVIGQQARQEDWLLGSNCNFHVNCSNESGRQSTKTNECHEDVLLTMAELYSQGEMYKECLELLENRDEEGHILQQVKDSESLSCLMVKSWVN